MTFNPDIMYSPEQFLTVEVLERILAEYTWPLPYRLEDELPDGVVVSFPKSHLMFSEGFEGDMELIFLPEDTGVQQSLKLEHALLTLYPFDGKNHVPELPGLIKDGSPHASLKKVENGIRDICHILLNLLVDVIRGDFSWVEQYLKMQEGKGRNG